MHIPLSITDTTSGKQIQNLMFIELFFLDQLHVKMYLLIFEVIRLVSAAFGTGSVEQTIK